MSLDLRHILKVYNYVNDEKRSKVNVKFLALFAAFLVAAGALVAFAALRPTSGGSGPANDASTHQDFIPLTAGLGEGALDQQLAAWQAAHPGAHIDRTEDVYDAHGLLIGEEVYYH